MADSAEFDLIMNNVETGDTGMIADAADSLADYNSQVAATTDESERAAQSVEKTAEQLEKEASAAEAATDAHGGVGMSLTELNSGFDILTKTLGYAEQAYDATIGKAMSYGETIRNLSIISGQGAEDTSRMVQVLDDFQVSAEDVEAATRKMTANGLVPNLDTIASLGEQYRAIQDPLEKNKFVTDNLGKSGQNWNMVLGQTREQLQAASGAVNENLILNEKQLKQLDQLRLAQDNISDTQESIAISLGTKLAPAMNNWLTILDKGIKGTDDQRFAWLNMLGPLGTIVDLTFKYGQANNENEAALAAATDAEKNHTTATLSAADAEKLAKEAADARNETLTTQLALASSIQSQMDTYSSSLETIRGQQEALTQKISEAAIAYGGTSQQVIDLKTQYDELGTKATDLAAKNSEAMAKMRIDNLQAKLAVDGISDADYNLIIAEELKAGIITKSAAEQAVAMNTLNTQLAAGAISQQQYDEAVANGSMTATGTNDALAQSDTEKTQVISRNSDELALKVDALSQKTAAAAAVTETSNIKSMASWNTWGDSVSNVFDSLMVYIDAYKAAVSGLPAPPAVPGASGASGESAGVSSASGDKTFTVNILFNSEYQQTVYLT